MSDDGDPRNFAPRNAANRYYSDLYEDRQPGVNAQLSKSTPHQAPQRTRFAQGRYPASKLARMGRQQRNWKQYIRPDVNMGVPQLMMILEPRVVWNHTHANLATARDAPTAQAVHCQTHFFDGFHQGGAPAHGVYEGSYWQLIADAEELRTMLTKLGKAPALMPMPAATQPRALVLPSWDEFRPALQPVPEDPQHPDPVLPAFRPPLLEPEPVYVEPLLQPLPQIPKEALDEAVPAFTAPPAPTVPEPVLPELQLPAAPAPPPQPEPFVPGRPAYGEDWSGERPFQRRMPLFYPPEPLPEPGWSWPDGPEAPPELAAALEAAGLQPALLPEPEAPDDLPETPPSERASAPGAATPPPTQRTTAEAGPPQQSGAGESSPGGPASLAIDADGTPANSEGPAAARTSGMGGGADLRADAGYVRSATVGPAPLDGLSQTAAGWGGAAPPAAGAGASGKNGPSAGESVGRGAAGGGRGDGGTAEERSQRLPLAPSEPLNSTDYPDWWHSEGAGEHVPALELPEFEPPQEAPLPVLVDPEAELPVFAHPCEPRPVGYMRGVSPVIIFDVSGTMHPRRNGKFATEIDTVAALLEPFGEMMTQRAFDVIAFCGGAFSWSASHEARTKLVQSTEEKWVAGRQAGNLPRPGTAPVRGRARTALELQPCTPDLLYDAQNWVKKWPEARGNTCLSTALELSQDHWPLCDALYVFSDGLVDDAGVVEAALTKAKAAGARVPPIHAVGIFPEHLRGTAHNPGERFLRRLAEITGGSFQEHAPKVHKVFRDGEFREYDLASEAPGVRTERLWVEARITEERQKNAQRGVAEGIADTIARVHRAWRLERYEPAAAAAERASLARRAEHARAAAEAREGNARRLQAAREAHDALARELSARHAAAVAAAEAANRDRVAAHGVRRAAWLAEQRTGALEDQSDARGAADKAVPDAWDAAEAVRVCAEPAAPATPPKSEGSAASAATAARGAGASASGAAPLAFERRAAVDASAAAERADHVVSAPLPAFNKAAVPSAAGGAIGPEKMGSDRVTNAQGLGQTESTGEGSPFVSLEAAARRAEVWEAEEFSRPPKPPSQRVLALQAYEAELARVRDHNERWVACKAANEAAWGAWESESLRGVARRFVQHFLCDLPAVRELNGDLMATAEAEHAADVEEVTEDNKRTAALHSEELDRMAARQAESIERLDRWEAQCRLLAEEHQAEAARVSKEHATAVHALTAAWEMEREIAAAEHRVAVTRAEGEHQQVVAAITERNKQRREEYRVLLAELREKERYNARVTADAKSLHAAELSRVQKGNNRLLESARAAWEEACDAARAQHEVAVQAAFREHEALKEAVIHDNEELLAKRRAMLQDKVAEMQMAWDLEAHELEEQHRAATEAAVAYNKRILPQVQVAGMAQDELLRVTNFLAHIRLCANKLHLGVNFVPGTPNLARVVEMQALSEALLVAFPELGGKALKTPLQRGAFLPWPDHDNCRVPGHGWSPSKAPPSLAMPDVFASTRAIMAGRPHSAPSARARRRAHGAAGAGSARERGAAAARCVAEVAASTDCPPAHVAGDSVPGHLGGRECARTIACAGERPASPAGGFRKPARARHVGSAAGQHRVASASRVAERIGFKSSMPRKLYPDVDLCDY